MSVRRLASLVLYAAGATACNGLLGISAIPEPHDGGGVKDSSVEGSPDSSDDREASDEDASNADASNADASNADASNADASNGDASNADASDGCYPAPSGIVSWWRAEGTAMDSAGANDGSAASVSYVPGVVGQAFHFNGSAYVSAGTVGFPLGADDRTVEMWARISVAYAGPGPNVYSLGLFLGYGGWTDTKEATYEMLVAGGSAIYIPPNTLAFSQWGTVTTVTSLTESAWHHIAATLTGGVLAVYLDGAIGIQSDTVPVDTAEQGTTYIGGLPIPFTDSPTAWLTGDVDEAAVYARALSANEIRGIFSAGGSGKCR